MTFNPKETRVKYIYIIESCEDPDTMATGLKAAKIRHTRCEGWPIAEAPEPVTADMFQPPVVAPPVVAETKAETNRRRKLALASEKGRVIREANLATCPTPVWGGKECIRYSVIQFLTSIPVMAEFDAEDVRPWVDLRHEKSSLQPALSDMEHKFGLIARVGKHTFVKLADYTWPPGASVTPGSRLGGVTHQPRPGAPPRPS